MGRAIGPKCKLCRSSGEKLFLKGSRCHSDKCAMERRPYSPGQHGRSRGRKLSNYGVQLKAKQKAKKIYCVLEKQFRKYFDKADRQRGVTGTNLLCLLERRMDMVVYRMGCALSRPHARQLVRHNFFTVNGKKVTIPSYQLKVGDVVEVNTKEARQAHVRANLELTSSFKVPEWLSFEEGQLKGSFVRFPERDEMDQSIDEQLIVELYSK
ncbi:30S ribosomal protein S4 [PVC group bacterium (ex Bugula neritina AB1)]|nr:30S ribosomal protein S4 [PVC group bacterium (ex Bugula neritina AB1)]